VLDVAGREVAHLAAGEPDRPSRAPLVVQPGVYRVVVAADKPRASLTPYRVVLREAPENAALPGIGTPTGL
jgi:hypothetical protein